MRLGQRQSGYVYLFGKHFLLFLINKTLPLSPKSDSCARDIEIDKLTTTELNSQGIQSE